MNKTKKQKQLSHMWGFVFAHVQKIGIFGGACRQLRCHCEQRSKCLLGLTCLNKEHFKAFFVWLINCYEHIQNVQQENTFEFTNRTESISYEVQI